MKYIVFYLRTVIDIATLSAIAVYLAYLIGPWIGLLAWSVLIGFLASFASLLLKTSPMGKLTWRNRFGGLILLWGHRLGNGNLFLVTLAACVIWILVGAAAIFLIRPHSSSATSQIFTRQTSAYLLFATWIFYYAMMNRQLGYVFNQFRLSGRPRMTMIQITLVMLGLIIASGFFWLKDQPKTALLIGAGPLLAIGGIYGLFVGSMLIFGRNARWN